MIDDQRRERVQENEIASKENYVSRVIECSR